MALSAGSVTVAADGSHSGSGWALAAYEGRKAARDARWDEIGVTLTTAQRVDIYRMMAAEATAEAESLVPYIIANI